MLRSAELADLFSALAIFQSAVEAIPKDSTNPFFKSKYAALPDVVAKASPLLTENGLSVTQLLGHDEQGDTLTTIVGHKSGQFIGDTMRLRPVKDDPQAQGSATTYGRRYAYMAALGLVADEDDDGNTASRGKANTTAAPARKAPDNGPINGALYERLTTAFRQAGTPFEFAHEQMDKAGVPVVEHDEQLDPSALMGRRVALLKAQQAEVLISELTRLAREQAKEKAA